MNLAFFLNVGYIHLYLLIKLTIKTENLKIFVHSFNTSLYVDINNI